MRWLAMTAVVAGCSTSSPCEEETVLPPSGGLRRGVWIADASGFSVAASPGGAIAREGCANDVRLLGADLATASSLEVPYAFDDAKEVTDLARDEDGIAVVTFSGRRVNGDLGDVDVQQHLTMFGNAGNPAWRIQIAEGNVDVPDAFISLGPDQIYIARDKRIDAVSRATGEAAWQRLLLTAVSLEAAADPTGGVVVTGNFTGQLDTGGPTLSAGDGVRGYLVSYAPDGTVRWALTSDAIGFDQLESVAVAPDGTVAVLGGDGSIVVTLRSIAMLAADRSVRWSLELGDNVLPTSLRTDGAHVVVAGQFGDALTFAPEHVANGSDGFIASFGEAGVVDTVHVATGPSTERMFVDAILPGAIVAHVHTFEDPDGSAFEVAGVPVPGAGVAIVELAR